MLQNFQSFSVSLSVAEILFNITVALACGYFISWLYKFTYKGQGYSNAFVNSMILLSMITALVLMVIGNNLARAFGLVGAMSIIRFRTAVKETQDIIFIFFSLAVGMAAGVGYHLIAITGTLFIGLWLYLLSNSPLSANGQNVYLLQFYYSPNGENKTPYVQILKKYCKKYETINVKSPGERNGDNVIELSYSVDLKSKEKNDAFIRDLSNIKGIQNINLFYDTELF